MYKLILFLGICLAFATGSKLKMPSKVSEKILGCYFTENVPYNSLTVVLKENAIDVSLCSHLFYSFVIIHTNTSVEYYNTPSTYDPEQLQQQRYHLTFKELRKKNPGIKTLANTVTVDHRYSDKPVNILPDPHLREGIVNNTVNFVKKHLFNGIDLDLTNIRKFPVRPTDKKNLVLLLKALKERFDKEGFILSVSVDPKEEVAKRVYDIKGISTYVNFINLMAFDFNEPLDQTGVQAVAHYSPLYHSSKEKGEERKQNIDYVVRYWIRNGAPANKLILGTAFRSRVSYALANTKQIGRGAPITDEGDYSYSEYVNICTWPKKRYWKYFFDKEQQVPYTYKGNELLPFDDVASIKAKAEYINKMKLGGVVATYIDDDDFFGRCGEKFPLLKTLNRVLRNKP